MTRFSFVVAVLLLKSLECNYENLQKYPLNVVTQFWSLGNSVARRTLPDHLPPLFCEEFYVSWAPLVELGSAGKESACNVGDFCSIPGLGRSPGKGKGYPHQYSGLKNYMDCTVHGVAKNWTQLSDFSLSFCVSCLRGGLPNSRRLEVLVGEAGKSLYLCGQRLCSLLQGETRISPIFFSIWCIWTVVLEKTLQSPLD